MIEILSDNLAILAREIIYSRLPLALTALERVDALRSFRTDRSLGREHLGNILLVTILILMLILLVRTSYNRIQQERRLADQAFHDNVQRCGLSVREYHILMDILSRCRLKRRDAIFRLPDFFDRGAEQVLNRTAEDQGPEAHQRLIAELGFLREKLGFLDRLPTDALVTDRRARSLSTREIPVGKKLYVTRRLGERLDHIEAPILANNEDHLILGLQRPVKVTVGEVWRARYYFGASVWEFDTAMVSYDGDRLVLQHSTDIRFVNRRRFARVPVHNLAFLCRFPFTKTADPSAPVTLPADSQWKPLEFVHAVVTEMAGPGLRVEASLKVEPGERLLVIFRIDPADASRPRTSPSRIIEDLGIVRRVERVTDAWSIALELVGLHDSNVDELVRVTNAAALAAGREAVHHATDEQIEDDSRIEQAVEKEV